jgi:hypothetical protein
MDPEIKIVKTFEMENKAESKWIKFLSVLLLISYLLPIMAIYLYPTPPCEDGVFCLDNLMEFIYICISAGVSVLAFIVWLALKILKSPKGQGYRIIFYTWLIGIIFCLMVGIYLENKPFYL